MAAGIQCGANVDFTVDISLSNPDDIVIENLATVAKHVWLNVPTAHGRSPKLFIRQGARIGRGSVLSAKNRIEIGRNAMTGPHVLIMDHAHAFQDISVPICDQGLTDGGEIIVESGCWIGFGAAIISSRGILRIGQNSVIAANSVVTRSVEAGTVVAGAPAKVIRRYCATTQAWERV